MKKSKIFEFVLGCLFPAVFVGPFLVSFGWLALLMIGEDLHHIAAGQRSWQNDLSGIAPSFLLFLICLVGIFGILILGILIFKGTAAFSRKPAVFGLVKGLSVLSWLAGAVYFFMIFYDLRHFGAMYLCLALGLAGPVFIGGYYLYLLLKQPR